MSRLEAWLTHIAAILLTITGIVYAWMHYMMKSQDPFSVVNHPWEPFMMDLHIIVAPILVLLMGMLVRSHILVKLESDTVASRRSGILLIPLFVIMALSGYLLQVITATWKNVLVVVHLGSGLLWFVFYVGHYLSSVRLRKLMRASAAFEREESGSKSGSWKKLKAAPRSKQDLSSKEREKRF